MQADASYDAIIVGAGPAGLSAALILGRCRRRVLVCDAGHPRNEASHSLHGFLSRDGIAPAELLRLGREQLAAYASVHLREVEVTHVRRIAESFEVDLADGTRALARKLLLATGVRDRLPDVEGVRELYGTSVFHCPYCDGWEVRDQALAVYGRGKTGTGLALELLPWSTDVTLCTHGEPLEPEHAEVLAAHGITVRTNTIRGLEGAQGRLERIRFTDGSALECRGMFFSTGQDQRSDLALRLGCVRSEKGAIRTGEYEATNVPGVYVAGDASERLQLAIVAAAEGAGAAFAIHSALSAEEVARATPRVR